MAKAVKIVALVGGTMGILAGLWGFATYLFIPSAKANEVHNKLESDIKVQDIELRYLRHDVQRIADAVGADRLSPPPERIKK